MCGRFTLKTPVADWLIDLFPELASSANELIEQLGEHEPQLLKPRYNIAPSQPIMAVCKHNAEDLPSVLAMRWGLVPSWSDSASIGNKMINARSETLAEKPSFKSLLATQRCVIIGDGYYEWQANLSGTKQPYWIHRPSEKPFAMAGLWSINNKVRADSTMISTAIITTSSNTTLRPVHDRMPAIFATHEDIAKWLDPSINDSEQLLPLLRSCEESFFALRAVSTQVNKPIEAGAQLIANVD